MVLTSHQTGSCGTAVSEGLKCGAKKTKYEMAFTSAMSSFLLVRVLPFQTQRLVLNQAVEKGRADLGVAPPDVVPAQIVAQHNNPGKKPGRQLGMNKSVTDEGEVK